MRGQLQLFVDDDVVPTRTISLKKLMADGKRWLEIHGRNGLVKAVFYIETGPKIPESFSISIRYYQLDEINDD